MSKRFHINNTKQVTECRAQNGKCPFRGRTDGLTEHFDTREGAEAYLHASLSKAYPDQGMSRKKSSKIATEFGKSKIRVRKPRGFLTLGKIGMSDKTASTVDIIDSDNHEAQLLARIRSGREPAVAFG